MPKKQWTIDDAKTMQEPDEPALPQFKSGSAPATSGYTYSGPLIHDDVEIARSRYWLRVHAYQLDCGAVCGEITSFTTGIERKTATAIEGNIGAKLDDILPGLKIGLSGKKSASQSESVQKTTTHTCSVHATQCNGADHAEYQLIDQYIFKYRSRFLGTACRTQVESREPVFRFIKMDIPRTGCCEAQDARREQLRAEGYTQPVVIRDGAIAAIIIVRPLADGSFQADGIDEPFHFGDPASPEIVIRSYGHTGKDREEWLAASPHWEPYEGPLAALDPQHEAASSSGASTRLGLLALGLVAGGALALLMRKRNTSASGMGSLSADNPAAKEAPPLHVELLPEKPTPAWDTTSLPQQAPQQAQAEAALDSE